MEPIVERARMWEGAWRIFVKYFGQTVRHGVYLITV